MHYRFVLRTLLAASALSVGFSAETACAQVIEPNGISVPVPSTNGEQSLQAYFDAHQESIDSVKQASATPGAFSPLCDFTATLVMSESMGKNGLAWYNVPTDPNVAPTTLYPIVPPSARVTGQTFSATAIRQSQNYQGGLIGFALTDESNLAIYYSEYQRNPYCSQCTGIGPTGGAQMPGYWKMMLAYQSTQQRSSYYIGFEDWPSANQSTWQDNDGDFQDKVFLVTGVSCPGGGEPCDTQLKGVCATGLTECAFDGAPKCKAQVSPKSEQCDNIDNDCDGTVDNGDLCGTEQVCVRGKCVHRCNTGEFRCEAPLVCGADGYCIDTLCKDVNCGAGLACRSGKCVGECEGVMCPLGQLCRQGACIDPCAGVSCPDKTFCDRGVCVGDCACSPCPSGKECGKDGRCVAVGCGQVTCAGGDACQNGACVPRCTGAVCPRNGTCENGACQEPAMGGASNLGGSPSTAGSGGGLVIVGAGGASHAQGGALPQGGALHAGGAAGGSTPVQAAGNSGCSCRVAPRRSRASLLSAVALIGFLLTRRRRSRSRSTS